MAQIPGWARECTALEAITLKAGGCRGRGETVDKSQSSCRSPKVALDTLRDRKSTKEATSRQELWLTATNDMSRLGVERKARVVWGTSRGWYKRKAQGGSLATVGHWAIPAEGLTKTTCGQAHSFRLWLLGNKKEAEMCSVHKS